jgi:predicted regulator of Ras-like GTPase activity (Roadblock/LC7/MglB family)
LELGQLERVLLEGEHYIIGIFPVTGDASLAVLIDKEAKLGLTFHLVSKATENIADVLNTTR